VPAILSAAEEGSGGGCNSELGFCAISGKSGGRVGGLTGGGSTWSRSSGLGMALVLVHLGAPEHRDSKSAHVSEAAIEFLSGDVGVVAGSESTQNSAPAIKRAVGSNSSITDTRA
jgi:hypothetical protein